MNKLICITCGEVIESEQHAKREERLNCPNGRSHIVLSVEEASDIVNDYIRLRKELEKGGYE